MLENSPIFCDGGASYTDGGGGLAVVLVHGLILRCGAWPRILRLADGLFSTPG